MKNPEISKLSFLRAPPLHLVQYIPQRWCNSHSNDRPTQWHITWLIVALWTYAAKHQLVQNIFWVVYLSPYNHLGFPIGNVNQQDVISHAVNQFTVKVNMVMSHFKHIRYDIMYKMFKTYWKPLYGCPLWDYTGKTMNKFYVAWRNAIIKALII